MYLCIREAVTGSSLNGYQMTDFLTYNTSQQISGTYEFTVSLYSAR